MNKMVLTKQFFEKKWKPILIITLIVLVLIFAIIGGTRRLHNHHTNSQRSWELRTVFAATIMTFMPNIDSHDFTSHLPSPYSIDGDWFSYWPNVTVDGLFRLNYRFPLHRRIGREDQHLGDLRADVRFSQIERVEVPGEIMSWGLGSIAYPSDESNRYAPDFTRLEQLPEHTMVEVYISFTELMTTPEVFRVLDQRNMSLDWLAVYSGTDSWNAQVGFPHNNHWNQLLHRVEPGIGIGPNNFPSFIAQRENSFIRTIEFLNEHRESLRHFPILVVPGARVIPWAFDFESLLAEIEENGVRIPGVVLTGPTTEILELRDELWISSISVNNVTLLDWPDWNYISLP